MIYLFYYTPYSTNSATKRVGRKREEWSVFRCGRKKHNGENPRNQVGTDRQIKSTCKACSRVDNNVIIKLGLAEVVAAHKKYKREIVT